MAFPTIVGTPAESATTSAGTTHTINLPSGASGNLFLLVMGKGTTSATINALTGWNELVDENQASGAFCAWRTCDGTEGATTAFTSSASTKSATIVYEINGQSAVAPQISAVASASTNAPNPNTVTPTGGAKDYLWITFFVMGQASEEADDDTWVNNAATNYGSLLQKTSGTVGTNIGAAVAACHRTNNAASEDAAWPTGSTDLTITWRSFTVAIHPLQLVSADTGSIGETGVAATLLADRMLAGGAATGAYTLSGVAATLERGRFVSADVGTYANSGVDASLGADRLLADGAAPGSSAFTGADATLAVGRGIEASAGTVALAGVDATFTIDAAEVFISADPGSYSGSGVAATLNADRVLEAGIGAIDGTGVAASLYVDRVLDGGVGGYVESGAEASLAAGRMISSDPGVISFSGLSATLMIGRGIVASPGTFAVDGVATGLEYVGGSGGVTLIPQSMAFGARMGIRMG